MNDRNVVLARGFGQSAGPKPQPQVQCFTVNDCQSSPNSMQGHRPGGRPACPDSVHFVILEELGRAKDNCECRHCRAAYDNDTTNIAPIVIVATSLNYRSHPSKGGYFTATQLPPASPFSADSTPTQSRPAASPSSEQSISSRTRSQTATAHPVLASYRASREPRVRRTLMLEQHPPRITKKRSHGVLKHAPREVLKSALHSPKRQFSRSEIKQLERALVEMHADNRLPDRFIEQESVLRVLEILCPGVTAMLPSRRILGGRLLKEHAKRCFEKAIEALRTMQTNTEGRVNLSSDVWMNIAKEHLLGVH
ncbi:hypothetical protein GQ600_15694 [Phytophthora cactorum]|nr:hypothetical protein GQ600_15694 [Phytophthora cactorum]